MLRKPGRWKLWHFVVLVLLAALVFGAIRAIATGGNAPINGVSASLMLLLAGLAQLAMIRAGRWLFGPAISASKDWGIRIGGVIGFLVWVATIGLEIIFHVLLIVVVPVAAIGFLIWLATQIGR